MFAVAIDGPSGAGKSSVAKAVAEQLGFIYVDTGAIYRTAALALTNENVNLSDEIAIKAVLENAKIEIKRVNSVQKMFLAGKDVSEEIRTPENTKAASVTAAVPCVRVFLLEMQRKMAETSNIIMDGRDIGTVVLPNAEVKIFLTASAEERANRRLKQMKESGMKADFNKVLEDIIERDKRDTERATSPLKAADDAVFIDSSNSTKAETVAKIVSVINEKRKQ